MPTGVITYGHMPLMVTRACPLQNIHDCAHCDKTGLLTDRKAKKFPVRCGLGVRTIYNPVPIYMGDKPGALTVDYGVAYFTLESREEAAAILDSIRQHAPFEGEFTATCGPTPWPRRMKPVSRLRSACRTTRWNSPHGRVS